MSTHVFGIRHHGPGCARSLRAALEALAAGHRAGRGAARRATRSCRSLADEAMRPPVALLIYAPDDAASARSTIPFADFSPEWQALQFAPARGTAGALHRSAAGPSARRREDEGSTGRRRTSCPRRRRRPGHARGRSARSCWRRRRATPTASSGGSSQIEQRQHAADLFEGILEAMTRAARGPRRECRSREARREAHMRRGDPRAQKEGFAADRRRLRRLARAGARAAEAGPRGRRAAQGPAEDEGRGHLDSLDESRLVLPQRLRRGRDVARLVRSTSGPRPSVR